MLGIILLLLGAPLLAEVSSLKDLKDLEISLNEVFIQMEEEEASKEENSVVHIDSGEGL